ncbi:MAG: SGNH/GDSL hydrolase family protein [Bacillota bacterium]
MQEDSLFISSFKFAMRLLLFFIIMIAVSVYFGKKYEASTEHNTINAHVKQRFEDFYALEPFTLDMAFLGSSHSYCTFDPSNFDTELGISSFQLGTPLQPYDTTYYTFKELLKTQSPPVVVVELYWDLMDEAFEADTINSFFDVAKEEKTRTEYISEVFSLEDKIKYYITPIRYQKDYFAYKGNEYEKYLEERYGVTKATASAWTPRVGIEEYRSKGYVYCDYIMLDSEYDETNQFKGYDGRNWAFGSGAKKYIEKMITVAKARNIQLIFVTAPVANVSMDYISNYHLINNEITAFAESHDVPYLDINLIAYEDDLLENRNFRDDAHLNDSGVKIVNAYFLQYLESYESTILSRYLY